ncbi:MAG: ferritin-like domain-containing protein [Solirubrobacterales bacterium]
MSLQRHLAVPYSRRRLMQGLGLTMLAGSPPVLLAACGSDGTASGTDTDEANDLRIVNAARALELAMVAGYTRVAALLDPAAAAPANQILAQEKQHADGLGTVAGDLGGTPVAPKTPAAYEQSLGLVSLSNRGDALRFAGELEQMAIYSYISAVPRLTIGDLRSTFASIATAEAEHASLLAGVEFADDPARQVPAAFVTGTKPTLSLN